MPVTALDVSVVVPVRNEAGTVAELARQVAVAADDAELALAEILFVDDGSTDGSWAALAELAAREPRVRALRLRRNFGKATALDVGIRESTGAVIVTMDADLQDDPAELPRFLAAMTDDVDLVSGWKQGRRDPLGKTLPSRFFNWVTARLSGVPLHDFNCGYKAYRREIFETITLYGELHRYVPVLAHGRGFRVAELPVRHHPRRYGRSNYGVERMAKGFLDLLTVLMLSRFASRPGHLFGGLGLALGAVGFAVLAYLSGLKLLTGAEIGDRPLLLLGVMLAIIAVQVTLFGVLGELIVSRTAPRPPAALIRERRD
ncbi:MAG: glycosyltransferase [Alphaproteobacteria bacterium]|nr:glycosyltransferase [Alphaproteobacteria bacterium]